MTPCSGIKHRGHGQRPRFRMEFAHDTTALLSTAQFLSYMIWSAEATRLRRLTFIDVSECLALCHISMFPHIDDTM